jgi:hypothetical protein
MSIIPAVCCCGERGLYKAYKCPIYNSTICCENDCENAPEEIWLCETFVRSFGLVTPLDLVNYCYIWGYACCAYVITEYFPETPCPPSPPVPVPLNVGWLAHFYQREPGDECCQAQSTSPIYAGAIASIYVPGCGPAIAYPNPAETPCVDVIAECYEWCDQYGTVRDLPIVFTQQFSICNESWGIPMDQRCDDKRTDQFVLLEQTAKWAFSICNQNFAEVIDGVRQAYTPPLSACANYQTQTWTTYRSCDTGGCWFAWRADCCTDQDECALNPNVCDAFADSSASWEADACYSPADTTFLWSGANQIHEECVLEIVVPYCYLLQQEIDWENQEQLDLWASNFVTFSAGTYPTCWDEGVVGTVAMQVCGYLMQIVSANALHIQSRINRRIGTIVHARTPTIGDAKWQQYFWFGSRQSCQPCPLTTPSERPPYIPGDSLLLGPVFNSPADGGVVIRVLAQAVRKYCVLTTSYWFQDSAYERSCDRLVLDPNYPVSAFITAESDSATLAVLSVPEYSSGERYPQYMRVEQDAVAGTICIPNYTVSVTRCPAITGWPLTDVVITPPPPGVPYVIQYGWQTLGPASNAVLPSGGTPISGCRCWPFNYLPAPCCPVDYPDCAYWENVLHPIPQPCVDAFQNLTGFCGGGFNAAMLQSCGTPDPYPYTP